MKLSLFHKVSKNDLIRITQLMVIDKTILAYENLIVFVIGVEKTLEKGKADLITVILPFYARDISNSKVLTNFILKRHYANGNLTYK